MIKTKIEQSYPHQKAYMGESNDSFYIADYTLQTKSKRSVEILKNQPEDIEELYVDNTERIPVSHVVFNEKSFTKNDGSSASQCECTFFPEDENASWITFVELKYSYKHWNNRHNLKKARCQLFKTRSYYLVNGIIDKNKRSYLIASMPLQDIPFANFQITQDYLIRLRKRHNVVLKLTNHLVIRKDRVY